LAQVYRTEHEVDVTEVAGAGAAGGLAGGLLAAGARLASGFEVVADEVGLYDSSRERTWWSRGGFLDEQSFEGKVVGGSPRWRGGRGPVLAVAGQLYDGAERRIDAVSLVDRFGEERAMADALACIEEVVGERLAVLARG